MTWFAYLQHLFTVSLAGSVGNDILITTGLMYFLRISKSEFTRSVAQLRHPSRCFEVLMTLSTTELVDTLMRYTLQTAAVPWSALP